MCSTIPAKLIVQSFKNWGLFIIWGQSFSRYVEEQKMYVQVKSYNNPAQRYISYANTSSWFRILVYETTFPKENLWKLIYSS